MVQKVTWLVEGFQFRFLPSPLSTHKHAVTVHPVLRTSLEWKLDFWVETPDCQDIIPSSGLDWILLELDPCTDSGLQSFPPGKQYGLKSRQLGSLNRKLSKALISSLPVFKTSNADTGYHQTSRPFYCLVSWTLISCFPSALLATPKPLIV